MHSKALAAMTAVGLAAAIAIPTIAFGNARSNVGSFNFQQFAETPYLVRMTGANEIPTAGDPAGAGVAAITFDDNGPNSQVCWDLSYSGLTGTPTAAHIHAGATGVANPPLVTFTPTSLGATSATGCAPIDPAVIASITA